MIHIRPKSIPSGATGTAYAAAYSTVTNQVSSGISPTPTYDANGNQLTSTPATLTWNALNQPITVNSTTATYDALGRMVEKGSGGVYTQFVYRPDGVLIGLDSNGPVKITIPLPGGSTAVYNATGLDYIRHKDWLGSSRFATTWQHAVASKEAYAPFGETYNEAGTADRSFTGQDQDVVTGSGGNGVYDFLFRKYDPSAGRWMSPDPLGWGAVDQTTPQSLNRYAYVENQPLNAVDPQGLELCISSDGDLYSNGPSNTSCPAGYTDAGPDPTVFLDVDEPSNKCSGSNPNSPGCLLVNTLANAPSNDMEYDIFHCPSCVNTWTQANCVVNKPFTTAADDLKWATAGAAFVGASGSMHSGVRGMLQGAIEQVGADVMAVGALGGIAFHSIVNTGYSLVAGCKSD